MPANDLFTIEYCWCVPANRCASLLSGLLASFILTWMTGIALPGKGQFIALGFIFLAILALSYPAIRAAMKRDRATTSRPLLLFVCTGNTCRSAMAEVIARTTIATGRFAGRWRISSAGIAAEPGAGMSQEAIAALDVAGISASGHRSRQLTAAMLADADTVYCMTNEHRESVLRIAADAAGKTFCLDPDGDIPDPHGQPKAAYQECADRIRHVISQRLVETSSKPTAELTSSNSFTR